MDDHHIMVTGLVQDGVTLSQWTKDRQNYLPIIVSE
jgi:hypothetical protein